MKKILLLTLLFISSVGMGQNKSTSFILQPDGTFLTGDKTNYFVYECPGKTAQELYNDIKTNIMKIYNSAKDVMSEAQYKSISIRGYKEYLIKNSLLRYYDGYYKIIFEFKDGKIKVNTPYIEDYVTDRFSGTQIKSSDVFDNFFTGGVVKENKKKYEEYIENYFNNLINSILSVESKKNDDW